MSVLLAKRALPRSLGSAPPAEIAAALAHLPGAFGQLGLASGAVGLDIKALKGQPGLYRLRVGDWRAVFVRTTDGFLVSAIGLRKDIYERVGRMRLGRKGEGVRIIELPPPQEARSEPRERAVGHATARAPSPSRRTRYRPFRTLSCCGSRALTLLWLRGCEGSQRALTSERPSCGA